MKGVKRAVYFIDEVRKHEEDCMKMIPHCEKARIIQRLIDDLNVFHQSYSSSNLLTTTTVTFHSKLTDDDHVVRLVRDVKTRQNHFELHSLWQSAVDKASPICGALLTIMSKGLVTFRMPGMKKNHRHSPIKMRYAGICYTLYYRLCAKCDRFIFFCAPSDIRSSTFKVNDEFEHIKEHVLGMGDCVHDLILNPDLPFDQLFITADVQPRPTKRARIVEEPAVVVAAVVEAPHKMRCQMEKEAAPQSMECVPQLENNMDDVPPRIRYVQNTDIGMAAVEGIKVYSDETENAPVNDTETTPAACGEDGGFLGSYDYNIMDDCEMFNGDDIVYGANIVEYMMGQSSDLDQMAQYQHDSEEAFQVKPFPFLGISCK